MTRLFNHFDNNAPMYLIGACVLFLFIGVAFMGLAGVGSYLHFGRV